MRINHLIGDLKSFCHLQTRETNTIVQHKTPKHISTSPIKTQSNNNNSQVNRAFSQINHLELEKSTSMSSRLRPRVSGSRRNTNTQAVAAKPA